MRHCTRFATSSLLLTASLILGLQILNQIQQTAVNSQRQLAISKNMTSAKERERKILQLTVDEINGLKKDVNLYKGIGKMSVSWYNQAVGSADRTVFLGLC